MLFRLVILTLTSLQWTWGQKIHELMTDAEVADIFQTTFDSVPEYDVVRFDVSRVNKRDLDEPEELQAKAFGDDIKLWLRPTEGVLAGQSTPVLKAERNSEGKIIYTEIPDAMKKIGKLMEDPELKATLIATKDVQGRYSFNGFIGSKNLVVRSLPDTISDELGQNHSSNEARITKSTHHVVYKAEEKNLNEIVESIMHVDLKTTNQTSSPSYSYLPSVVYPEIMVVVDYNLFGIYQYNVDKVLMYVLAFWNGVDLLYRSFEEPKFRFNIARVIIGMEHEATPYIMDNMYNSKLINAYIAHEKAQDYFFTILDIFPPSSYDAGIVMTSLSMTNGNGKSNILGIASTAGACFTNYRFKSVAKISLVHDDGTFEGVATAAHEFAHLLGASHDESQDCKSDAGYIMAPAAGVTENGHDFSTCTIKEIERFLRLNGGYCFYNKPIVTDPLPREFLPGLLSDRDHQCKMLHHGKSCYRESPAMLPCSAVYCLDADNPRYCYQFKSNAPPDGAFCGEGKVCLHGRCLKL